MVKFTKEILNGKIHFLGSEKVSFKLCMPSNLHIVTYVLISYIAKRSNYSFRSWVVKVYENSSDAQIALGYLFIDMITVRLSHRH